jgi:gliding motility-associated-like protein
MIRFLLLICCICFLNGGFSQNCPLDSALLIPFSDTVKYNLEVFDVVNDDLSNPNQGVCSIDINFDCNDIAGLEMWLVSPNGDTVQLAGPVVSTGIFGTLGFNWNITFLNENITPTAQPDFPYDQRFDNRINQFNAATGANYTGSYFPVEGNLADFNTGPVNGNWQLILHLTPDLLQVDGSQINDIHINFCDRRGYFCCFAEAGTLNNPNPVSICQRDPQTPDLSVNFPVGAADSSVYGYTYIISQSDTIVRYDSIPDLTQLAPGTYQIHGFSYQTDQRDSFPASNQGNLLSQLRDTLLSDLPPFCGSITNNSKPITILATPDTTFLGTQTICSGDSLLIGGTVLDTAGTYSIPTIAANGCDSIIQVEVNVQQPSRDTIIEETFSSGPFLSSTGETFDSSGLYIVRLSSSEGCDSIIVVDYRNYSLSVEINASADIFTCRDSVILLDGTASSTEVGRFSYRWEAPPFGQVISTDSVVAITEPGRYTLQLIHEAGGFPTQTQITIGENLTAPTADVLPPPLITCTDSTVSLIGVVGSGSGSYAFRWESPNGQITAGANSLSPTINRPGDYQFILTDESNGCRDTAAVQVSIDTLRPDFTITGNDTLNCTRTAISPVITLNNNSGNYSYEWLNAQGQVIPQGNTASPIIMTADTFQVSVTDLDNGCLSQTTMISTIDTLRPVAAIAPPGLLDCQVREITLSSSSSLPLDQVAINWSVANGGNIIAGDSSLNPTINAAGNYFLNLTNTQNTCTGQASVVVRDTSASLTANIMQRDILTCSQNSTVLSSSGSSMGPNIRYSWTDLYHGSFSGQPGDSVRINRPGRYQLLVEDIFTNCIEVSTLSPSIDTQSPQALTGTPAQLNCSTTQVTLGDGASAQNPNLQYRWQGPCLLSRADSIQVEVNCPGIYALEVTNTDNGCTTSRTVEVERDTTTPTAVLPDSVAIDCSTGQAFLDGSASFGGTLEWFFEGNDLNTNEDSLLVTSAGLYTLRVNNNVLQCTDERRVVVTSNCKPRAIILAPDSLNCQNTSVILNASTSEGVALGFQWTGPGGTACFVNGDSISPGVEVRCPGLYQVIVTNRVVNESDTATVQIIEDTDLPVADAGPDIFLTCDQPTLTRSALSAGNPSQVRYRWTTTFGITLGNQASFDFDMGGTYVLEVENPNNNCVRRDTLLVIEPEFPNLEIQVPEILSCADSSVLLDPIVFTDESVLNYEWAAANPSTNFPAQETIEVVEPGLYFLRVTDTTNQCTFLDSIEVFQDRRIPQVSAGSDTTLNCDTPQIGLNGSVAATDRSFEYRWLSDGSNSIVSGDNSLNPIVQDTGTYQLLVLDLDNGCINTDSLRVLPPRPLPDLALLNDTTLTCEQSSVLLLSPVIDSQIYALSWTGLTDTGIQIDTSFGPTFLAEASGSYTLTLRDQQTACTSTRTIRVETDTVPPSFALQAPDSLTCLNPTVSLNTENIIDTNRLSFTWTGEQVSIPTQALPLPVQQPGIYTLTVKDKQNGCQSQESLTVTESVHPPDLVMSPTAVLTCADDTLQLAPEITANVQATWSGPQDGLISTPGTLNAIVRLPGTYQLDIRDPITGCTNQGTVMVSQDKTPPSLRIDSSQNLTLGCVQTSIMLDASQAITSSGQNVQYQWNSLEGISSEAAITVNRPQTIDLQLSDPQNGCTSNYSFIIQQDQEQPRFQLESDGTLGCGKETVNISPDFFNRPADLAYEWVFNGVPLAVRDERISVQDTGLYVLRSTNTNNGCSFEQSIRVINNPEIPVLTIEVDTSLECTIDQVRLDAVSTNYASADLTYRWMTADGLIRGDNANASIFAAEQGTYQLSVIHPPSGCAAAASGTVLRRGRRIENISFSIRPKDCDPAGGGRLSISGVRGGTAPYLYDFNGGGLASPTSIDIAGAGTYSLVVEDLDGCRLDTTFNLSIPDLPLVNLGRDKSIREGDSIRLEAEINSENYERLEWIATNAVLATDTKTLSVRPDQSTAYTVRTSTADGCIFEDIVWVFMEEAPIAYLPTAFSPNGDGINDRFWPGFSTKVIRVDQFYVYDRWGNIVHTIQDTAPDGISAGWNGEKNNQPAPSAVYVFWMEVSLENGEKRQLKGEVILIR